MNLAENKKKLTAFNIQNEQLILANMIKSNKVRRKLAKELKPYHWIGKKHRVVFNIFTRMVEKNLDFDIDTFESMARDTEDYGGPSYVMKLEALFEENANIEYHVNVLKADAVKHHIKERRMDKLIDVLEDPHSEVTEINSIIDKIKEEVAANFQSTHILSGIELRKDYWKDLQERCKASIFVPTGIKGLDRWLTEGFARKKSSIWSARPGMGKTTTMANIALSLTRGIKNSKGEYICEPKKVLIAPLETGHISYLDIMVSILIKEKLEAEAQEQQSALPSTLIGMKLDRLVKESDKITDEEMANIKWAMEQIFSNENLHVVDNPMLSLDELETILEEGNYDVCIIDLWERLSDIEIDAGKITKKLTRTQAIAKRCNVHMAIVHQQRRSSEKGGKNKKPTMEALKNSGAYEEIADLVVFMYRAKYYNPELEEDVIEYIVAKQRRGAMNKSAFHDFLADFGMVGSYRKNYVENTESDVF
jgi:replicative DNA helicase